jgi:hypothetical protein
MLAPHELEKNARPNPKPIYVNHFGYNASTVASYMDLVLTLEAWMALRQSRTNMYAITVSHPSLPKDANMAT